MGHLLASIKKIIKKNHDLYAFAKFIKSLTIVNKFKIYLYARYLKKIYPTLIDEISKNQDLRNKYNGKRCFIIGNGPSLKSVDFEKLSEEYVFTVNQLTRNPNFEKLKTNFHVYCDSRAFDLNSELDEDREFISFLLKVKSPNNNPIVFLPQQAIPVVKNFELDKSLNIRYHAINYRQDFMAMNNYELVDYTKFKPNFPTIIQHTICLAVYMGFKKIYLLGCDGTSFVTYVKAKLKLGEESEYAYKISNNEKKRLERILAKQSLLAELELNYNVVRYYEKILDYCNKHKVDLYNATSPTLIDVIPKVNFNNLFNTHDNSVNLK